MAIMTKPEVLARTRDLVHDLRCIMTPGCSVTNELESLERWANDLEQEITKQVNDYLAAKYEAFNRPAPEFDMRGLSGRWGGWATRRRNKEK